MKINLTKPQASIIGGTPKRLNVFLAAQGTGKTHLMGVVAYYLITNYPKDVGFIAANTYAQLTGATLKKMKEVWGSIGLKEYERKDGGHYTDSIIPPDEWKGEHHNLGRKYNHTLVFSNQALVFHGSLDNYKAHDGKEFAWALLDETKDTAQEAIDEVILGRLRQGTVPNQPLYIFTSPAKVPWLNAMLKLEAHEPAIRAALFGYEGMIVIETETTRVVISTAYHNELNLPKTYISNQVAMLSKPKIDMLVYGYPFGQEGGEFYHKFIMQLHVVASTVYDPTKPLHLSYDFNVVPYLSIQAWQIHENEIHLVDEYAGKHPLNNTQDATTEFLKSFAEQSAPIFIYGDPSGRSRSTRQKMEENDFTLIIGAIKPKPATLRVSKKAPPVAVRGQFINNLFHGMLPWTIKINPKCEYTTRDLLNVKQSADGTKKKEKITNKEGVSYEPFGHMSDAMDYFLCQFLLSEFKRYIKTGTNG